MHSFGQQLNQKIEDVNISELFHILLWQSYTCVSFRCVIKFKISLNDLKVADEIFEFAWHMTVLISLSLLTDHILTLLMHFL